MNIAAQIHDSATETNGLREVDCPPPADNSCIATALKLTEKKP